MIHLIFTVTNDLTYDQRMQRICNSLANAGYQVTLVGRLMKNSRSLITQSFAQKRLYCYYSTGKLMYLEYNIRLFFFLLFKQCHLVCAIDLDTILPVYFVTTIRNTKRVYDAHELFTEQKEIVTRPSIYKLWMIVEKFSVPKFIHGYTVNGFIANELKRRYNVEYAIVRNLPRLQPSAQKTTGERFIIYQGAVNEGRSFETLIPAMQNVDATLVICGEGNYFEQVKSLIATYKLENKITLLGYVSPVDLAALTPTAYAAVMLFENTGMNQYHSLANRFFDYIMAGVPQVCVDYPEYRLINDVYKVAYLVPDTSAETIAAALNNLLTNAVLYKDLRHNCLKARSVLNWENEEKNLVNFYRNIIL